MKKYIFGCHGYQKNDIFGHFRIFGGSFVLPEQETVAFKTPN